MKIKITTNHPASSYGIPVCLVDGELVEDDLGLKACLKSTGWTRGDLAKASGKSLDAINSYASGRLPVPPNVWLVLRDQLGQ